MVELAWKINHLMLLQHHGKYHVVLHHLMPMISKFVLRKYGHYAKPVIKIAWLKIFLLRQKWYSYFEGLLWHLGTLESGLYSLGKVWLTEMKYQQSFCMKAMFCCIPESFQVQKADFGWNVVWFATSNCSLSFWIKTHCHKDPIFLLSYMLYKQPTTSCNMCCMYHKTLPTWLFNLVCYVYLLELHSNFFNVSLNKARFEPSTAWYQVVENHV